MSVRSGATLLHEFKYKDLTIIKKLGDGPDGEFGAVYKASQPDFEKLAVRVVSRRYFPRGGQRDVLRKEAERLFSIVSEHVIRLLGVVMDEEILGLVYEYAEYGPLNKLLERHRMDWPLKVRIAYEVALGMSFLHSKRIMHSRLRCRNVLIAGNIHVKISDIFFNRSREMNTWTTFAAQYSTSDLRRSASESTVAYIPPECARDINTNFGNSSDVYAYAIILWQIMTNKVPFEGLSNICQQVVEGLRPEISLVPEDRPEVLYRIMQEAWVDNKDQRPKFREIVDQIKEFFDPAMEKRARDMALKCQKDIDEFCFPDGNRSAPEGDLQTTGRPAHQHRSSQGDGRHVPTSLNDETVTQSVNRERAVHSTVSQTYVEPQQQQNRAEPERPGRASGILPENSARRLSTKDLYKVASALGQNWRQFGRHALGFKDQELDNIESNYHRNGYPEIPYQMLRRWNDANGASFTVSGLVKLLKDSDFSYITAYLEP